MNCINSILTICLTAVSAPLLLGIINRVKATFAGRKGQPVLQTYYDIFKLLKKSAVYSLTTSFVFKLGPVLNLAAIFLALTMIPVGPLPPLFSFEGDIFLIIYLVAIGRFATILSALDTGSSFEGMGASREAFFSALAEPAILISLLAVAKLTGSYSLISIVEKISAVDWIAHAPALGLIVVSLFIILLAENARIPVDDPNTHLELTMIHEVMVLDHSGPDFAAITYGAALKLWLCAAIICSILLPIHTGNMFTDLVAWLCGMSIIAVAVGVVESTMGRLRLFVVPQLLVGAVVLAGTGILMILIP
ncbi:MAG: NADH-quinone oxidoreductase subunit H [Verrucomicrobiae bacterium]|nr:NADH-quinone oxidoreductase subunit H [Verrucomicrobiae bacterium]